MATHSIINSAITGDRYPLFQRLKLLRAVMLLTALIGLAVLKWPLASQQPLYLPFFIVCITAVELIVSWLRTNTTSSIGEYKLLTHLFVDALLLCVLVYFTGGANNPFIYYLLVLIAIASALFDIRKATVFSSSCILAYTMMLWLNHNAHLEHLGADFQLHLIGMWLNFVGSAVLVTYFINQLSNVLRSGQAQLAAAREETLKNEQLIGIGTIAASTAHTLGTPLSTVSVLLECMAEDADQDKLDDIHLMQEQINRCKGALQKLTQISTADQTSQTPLSELVSSLKQHFLLTCPEIIPIFSTPQNTSSTSVHISLLLQHALINLIENALQAAKSRVEIVFKLTQNQFIIDIVDDGEGISHEVVNNWGQPLQSNKDSGLGIGIFLANSTIEKHGGTVSLLNSEQEISYWSDKHPTGTIIRVTLPLPAAELP